MTKVLLNMKTVEDREERDQKIKERMKDYDPEDHVFSWGSVKNN